MKIMLFLCGMENKKISIMTEAIGAAIINQSFNEDYIFDYMSTRITLTDELKVEVRQAIEKSKRFLVK